MFFTDFLKELHRVILQELAAIYVLDPKSKSIEFLFSVPTTWAPSVVKEFKDCIVKAGFEETKDHKADVTLTEAQAAALYTALLPDMGYHSGNRAPEDMTVNMFSKVASVSSLTSNRSVTLYWYVMPVVALPMSRSYGSRKSMPTTQTYPP